MGHVDVVSAFLNSEINHDDIYLTLQEGWPEGLNALNFSAPGEECSSHFAENLSLQSDQSTHGITGLHELTGQLRETTS